VLVSVEPVLGSVVVASVSGNLWVVVLSGEPVRLGSVDVVMVSEIARFFLDFLP
jgi:hypothetical protein